MSENGFRFPGGGSDDGKRKNDIDKFHIPTEWKIRWGEILPEEYPLVMLEYNFVLLNEIQQMQKTMNSIKNGMIFFVILTVIGLLLGFCSVL